MRFLSKIRQEYKNEREKIAYLASLTLLFSYAELILPRIVPFFRLGLSNIAILASFSLSFPSFFMLTILKAVAASLMSGTLFSPFFAISLSQSVVSGVFMFLLFRLNKITKHRLLSIYGISVSGSCISGAVQIILASLYLGRGTFTLLGIILIFNTLSGILTAVLVQVLEISNGICGGKPSPRLNRLAFSPAPSPRGAAPKTPDSSPEQNKFFRKTLFNILLISAIIILSAAIFLIRSIPVLCGFLTLSFILQIFCKRKIRFLPHISLWLFVLISTILVPSGKVLFSFWNFSITEGAVLSGIEKALKLSAVSALSQAAASIKLPESNILGLTLSFYRNLSDKMRASDGNILKRLKTALGSE